MARNIEGVEEKTDLFWEMRFENKNGAFYATVQDENRPFDIKITIDYSNQQHFTIEKIDDDSKKPKLYATVDMEYGKRNMPVARGQWKESDVHYKIIVYSPIHFELQLFHPDDNVTDIYRFMKTSIPDMPAIIGAIATPICIGLVYIAYKLIRTHEAIEKQEEEEKAKRRAEQKKRVENEEKKEK